MTSYQQVLSYMKCHPLVVMLCSAVLLLIPPVFIITIRETHEEVEVEKIWILSSLLLFTMAGTIAFSLLPIHMVVVGMSLSLPLLLVWLMAPFFLLLPISLAMALMGIAAIYIMLYPSTKTKTR